MLVFLPVGLTAWLGGVGGALLAAPLALVLNITLLSELLPFSPGWLEAVGSYGDYGSPLAIIGGLIIGYVRDFRQRSHYFRLLSYQAEHDPLTGLLSAPAFERALRTSLHEAKRQGDGVGVVFFNLDRFGFVNDSYGRAAGDDLLREVAARLRGSVRADDALARLGGDEFTLVLPTLKGPQHAAKVADKVLTLLSRPFLIDGETLYIGASAGISLYPGDGETAETLLKHANSAMHHAKRTGRNAYCFFTEGMLLADSKRFKIEHRLRLAVERDEFELHYQPQVDLTSGRLVGLEALLRWSQSELGSVSPADFIPIAEETGLIVPIGEWVLGEACRQARGWQEAGYPPVRVAVNVSAFHFAQPDFARTVAAALCRHGLSSQWLEIEITESLLMSDIKAATSTLNRLRELGVHTAIDDFGTGYSSLAYLQSLPINRLKIDRSFVCGIHAHEESDAAIITSAICSLAHNLRKRVVAGGVETENQLEFLKGIGCDEVQGYLFSRPLPAHKIGAILSRHEEQPVFTMVPLSTLN